MSEPCYFEVPGPFGVKGSTFSFVDRRGKLRTKTDSKHGKSFATAVRWAAVQAGIVCIPKGEGVRLEVEYIFERPKGCRRETPCVRPDLDKLYRAVGDALTGIAYDDDGQIVNVELREYYGDETVACVVVSREDRDAEAPTLRTRFRRP